MKVKYEARKPDGTHQNGMIEAKSFEDAFTKLDKEYNFPNETRIDFCKLGHWKFNTTFIVRHLKVTQ